MLRYVGERPARRVWVDVEALTPDFRFPASFPVVEVLPGVAFDHMPSAAYGDPTHLTVRWAPSRLGRVREVEAVPFHTTGP